MHNAVSPPGVVTVMSVRVSDVCLHNNNTTSTQLSIRVISKSSVPPPPQVHKATPLPKSLQAHGHCTVMAHPQIICYIVVLKVLNLMFKIKVFR